MKRWSTDSSSLQHVTQVFDMTLEVKPLFLKLTAVDILAAAVSQQKASTREGASINQTREEEAL